MKIVVLGAGRVGSAMVRDLAPEADVTVIDLNQGALDRLTARVACRGIRADLREVSDLAPYVSDCDLVICAVPGFMGFETLEKVIRAGKDVIDISFFAEDPFLLDDLARDMGVTAVVDCGVAPGLCNIIAGHVETRLDRMERYVCYVGGLPQVRQWPYEYQAVFSPIDVLEEYTRPARYVSHGEIVVRPALSEIELIDFPGVGTLEAFNPETDTSSMARTTGYTCTIVARQVLRGLFTQKGISPPEIVGRTPGCFEDLMAGYAQRNLHLHEHVTELDA